MQAYGKILYIIHRMLLNGIKLDENQTMFNNNIENYCVLKDAVLERKAIGFRLAEITIGQTEKKNDQRTDHTEISWCSV